MSLQPEPEGYQEISPANYFTGTWIPYSPVCVFLYTSPLSLLPRVIYMQFLMPLACESVTGLFCLKYCSSQSWSQSALTNNNIENIKFYFHEFGSAFAWTAFRFSHYCTLYSSENCEEHWPNIWILDYSLLLRYISFHHGWIHYVSLSHASTERKNNL